MSQPNFQATAVMLLRECFEGKEPARNYTWFVDGKEGLFDALDSVGAEQASFRVSAHASSLAAHAYHIRFALQGVNAVHGGMEPAGDWEGSWSRHAVTSLEWDELRAAIRTEYASFMQWFRNCEKWEDDTVLTEAFAVLPHMAFHLGAMRQLMRLMPG